MENTFFNKDIDDCFFKIKTIYPTKYCNLSNGETIGYREAGNGPNLLLIHGNLQSSIT